MLSLAFFREAAQAPPIAAGAGQAETPRLWDGEVCILYINCNSIFQVAGEMHRVIGTGRQISRSDCWKRGPSGESLERSCHCPVTWAWDDRVAPSRPSDRQ